LPHEKKEGLRVSLGQKNSRLCRLLNNTQYIERRFEEQFLQDGIYLELADDEPLIGIGKNSIDFVPEIHPVLPVSCGKAARTVGTAQLRERLRTRVTTPARHHPDESGFPEPHELPKMRRSDLFVEVPVWRKLFKMRDVLLLKQLLGDDECEDREGLLVLELITALNVFLHLDEHLEESVPHEAFEPGPEKPFWLDEHPFDESLRDELGHVGARHPILDRQSRHLQHIGGEVQAQPSSEKQVNQELAS